jgi:hypothetical protein
MIKVAVGPPTTPVTEGSMDMAMCTAPNICKMPGPPAPFVPTHFPNLGRSQDKLTDATSTVKMHKKKVAIRGAYYYSTGSPDIASKATGGGLISAQTNGKTEFVAPGATDVKAEGKNIQLLGDAMTNNGGSPTNSVTHKNAQAVAAATGLTMAEIKAICDAFCQAQEEYSNNDPRARGKGALTRRFQELVKKKQDAGLLRPNPPLSLQPEAWMFKAARGIGYRAVTQTAITALKAGHGGMGPMVAASVVMDYWAVRAAAAIPNLFAPDLVARLAGQANVLEAKFFWDKGKKDKLTRAQKAARKHMKNKFTVLKPDGSDGSPCKCMKSQLPSGH